MSQNLPKLAVFASGSGTNLQALINASLNGKLQAKVELVVSDKPDCFALTRATHANIATYTRLVSKRKDMPLFESGTLDQLAKYGIEWIALAGFMRILSAEFLRHYPKRVINIHPSLLPKYPGTHAIERAFEAGDEHMGVTVHYVDEGVDTGEIIEQVSFCRQDFRTLVEVTEKVHQIEHSLYVRALNKVISKC